MNAVVTRTSFAPAFIVLFLGLAAPTGHAHPVNFNSTITYSTSQPTGGSASIANWTGATFDAENIGGSGVNANGSPNNGTANDANTYVANNQPVQGQTFTTGSNANGYDVTGITVRMAGYTSNTASGSNVSYWNMSASNGPIIATIGKISGTTQTVVSIQNFTAGGTGNPGSGGSANGSGTYITLNLPFPVHLDPNTTYGFDMIIGNASGNYFEWLGIRNASAPGSNAYTGGTAYNRAGSTITLLAGDRVFMVNMTASATAPVAFTHPGVLHTQADFDRMASKVNASVQPWKQSADTLAASPYAQTNWNPAPVVTIIRTGVPADQWQNNYSRTQEDAQAIYELALRWKITGNTAYANQAVEIANAWANTLQGINGDSNAALGAGIPGYLFAIGGEILSTYTGWNASEKQAYKDMMMRVFYPANLNFLWWHYDTFWREGGNTHYRSNWDADAMAAVTAIGILCDNRAVYQQGLDFFKFGPGTGRVERMAWYIHPDGMAQTEESGRDQPHNLGAWCSMAMLCQMAWNQGEDLFGYDNNRVLRAFEYNAKYNLGNSVPWVYHRNTNLTYTETLSDAGRGLGQYYQYELVYSHYANVKGIAAPYSKLAMQAVRPEPRPNPGIHPSQLDWLGLGSLTFAQDAPTISAAPGGLRAAWSKNEVILTWWGSATATSYQVQRATNSGGPYTVLATVTGPELNYTDTNVANGTGYYYKVTAVTPGGSLDSSPLLVNQALVARYTFEGNADDSVGTRHATAMGGTTAPGYATGFGGGQAISLNGTDQYVQLPVGSGNYRDITIGAWVYWSGGSAWQRVFDFGTEIEKYMMLTVNEGSGKLLFQMTTSRNTDGTLTLTGPTMPTATWTHIAVTFNGDTATMYMNGEPVAAGASTGRISPMFGQPFCYLGRSMWNGDAYFSGRIDDFRIYKYALTGKEVYALWGQGGANSAPVFTANPMTLDDASEDSNYSAAGQTLAGTATDANGGTLTYSKVTGPSWLTVASNGALSGTPTNDDVGKNLFVVRVTDPSGATDDANLDITVDNTNDVPQWSVDPIDGGLIAAGATYSFSVAELASDIDAGNSLTYSKSAGPAWLVVATDGSISGTPGGSDAGINSFTLRVSDILGAYDDATFNVEVLPPSPTVAYWNFEEGTADTYVTYTQPGSGQYDGHIPDVSGNGNHLSAWSTNWHWYRAQVPAGMTPQLGTPNTLSVQNANSFPAMSAIGTSLTTWSPVEWTIEAAIRPDDATNGYQTIVGRDSLGADASDPNTAALYFQIRPDGRLRIKFTDAVGNNWEAESAANVVQDGKWHAVAATSDGNTLSLYLKNLSDGDPGYTLLDTTNISSSANPAISTGTGDGSSWDPGVFTVGRGLFAGDHTDRFFGHIDDIRFSNVALSSDELLYSDPPPVPANLTADSTSSSQADLNWTVSVPVDSFNIRRSTVNGGPYDWIAYTPNTSFSDTTVNSGMTYYYVVSSVRAGVESGDSTQAPVTVLNAIQSWRYGFFGTADPVGDAADDQDPDWDGKSNLIEYATGCNPTVPEHEPAARIGTNIDGTRLTLDFQRIADPALIYEVRACDELSDWEAIWSSTGSENEAGEVKVTDTESMSAHQKRFLQLRVSP